MKYLFDFFPVLLFFIAYKLFDIYVATAVIIGATFLQVGVFWLKHRRFQTSHLVTLVLVSGFGGATLLLHNPNFIKWKPTVLNWLFAAAFLGSQFIGEKSLVQRMMDQAVALPAAIWRRLNLSWVVFFIIMGAANLYVAFNFSENTWVNFKLFGIMGLTVLFVLLQALFISRHAHEPPSASEP
ncbi:MAG: septation protein A [Gammaproteobacteria bacterium]